MKQVSSLASCKHMQLLLDDKLRKTVWWTWESSSSTTVLSSWFLEEMHEVLQWLERHESEIMLVIICSLSRVGFLTDPLTTLDQWGVWGKELSRLLQRMERLSCPTLAIGGGRVVGCGLEFVLACTARWFYEDVRCGLTGLVQDLPPAAGGMARLTLLLGHRRAMHLILTSSVIGADRALELGLCDVVLPCDQDVETIRERVRIAHPIRRRRIQEHDAQTWIGRLLLLRSHERALRKVGSQRLAPLRVARHMIWASSVSEEEQRQAQTQLWDDMAQTNRAQGLNGLRLSLWKVARAAVDPKSPFGVWVDGQADFRLCAWAIQRWTERGHRVMVVGEQAILEQVQRAAGSIDASLVKWTTLLVALSMCECVVVSAQSDLKGLELDLPVVILSGKNVPPAWPTHPRKWECCMMHVHPGSPDVLGVRPLAEIMVRAREDALTSTRAAVVAGTAMGLTSVGVGTYPGVSTRIAVALMSICLHVPEKMVREVAFELGYSTFPLPEDVLRQRWVGAVLHVAATLVVEENISPETIDIAACLSGVWPVSARGGPCHWGDGCGWDSVVEWWEEMNQGVEPEPFPIVRVQGPLYSTACTWNEHEDVLHEEEQERFRRKRRLWLAVMMVVVWILFIGFG